mgnify:FL=1
MFKNLVSGENYDVMLSNGNLVHYINFDNAATTPPFHSVINSLVDFAPIYSSIHRGTGFKSTLSSKFYDEAREQVLDFVGGDRDFHTVIFLKNTTECINKLSYRLKNTLKDKIVLATYMEHHSNMLPWTLKYNTSFVGIDDNGRLDMNDLENKLKRYRGKVGLVAVSGASNVTGYINPIYDIARIAHKHGAKVLVDGAQLIPHRKFDMKPVDSPEHINYVAFSGHKMYAPFGTGALIAPKDTFKDGYSELVGGGTVKFVSTDDVIWADVPEKEEAGTPNLMGVVALTESIRTLKCIGMERIEAYERNLTAYFLDLLKNIPNLIIYDDFQTENKVSIISFNMNGLHHTELAYILNKEGGIAVRNGCFCAQPYVQRLLGISNEDSKRYRHNDRCNLPGMVRISFGLYNDYNEIDLFIFLINKISENIGYYANMYRNFPLD